MNTGLAAVVIPAYNESDRVARVIEAAQSASPYLVNVENIIVVDNGSIDDTVHWAEVAGARVLREPEIGKGYAVKASEQVARTVGGAAIITLDADLIGLRGDHIDRLVLPVMNNDLLMNIGYLGKRPQLLKSVLRFWGGFSGQRAISWEVFSELSRYDLKGYRLEAALNRIPSNSGRGKEIGRLELEGVRHVGQREKNSNNLLASGSAYARIYGSALLGLLTSSRMHDQTGTD